MRALLLILGLALPAFGQRVVEVPVIAAATAVHPTLMGSLGDPGSPLTTSLQYHAANLAKFSVHGFFDAHAAAGYLERLRDSEPLDRVAAGVLSRALQEPETMKQLVAATQAGKDSPLGRLDRAASPIQAKKEPSHRMAALAQAAAGDKEAALLFDGAVRKQTGVEPLSYRKDKLWHEGKPVKPLGQGGFGIVYPNPAAEGQVLKFTAVSFDAMMFAGAEPEYIYKSDVAVAHHLAKAGLGPRLLAEAEIDKMPVAVKERVYGRSVQQLIWDRAYGPQEHALVMDMIGRMARQRIRVGDMHPSNFIIGRTLVDPAIRAYHIDGGEIREVKAEETEDQLRDSLYHQAAIFKQRMDHGVGMVETTVALSTLLEQGLRRSQEKTFWQKLKGFFLDAYLNANIPGK